MRRVLRRAAVAAVLLLVAVFWLTWQHLGVQSAEAPGASNGGKPEHRGLADSRVLLPGSSETQQENQQSQTRATTAAEPVEPPNTLPPSAGEDSAPEERDPRFDLDVRPHPLGAARQRVQEQHALLEEVSSALEQGDPTRARELLRVHAREFSFDGWKDRQRGYQILIECVEGSMDEELEERVHGFLREERASPLRRHVRRTCLQARAFKRRT